MAVKTIYGKTLKGLLMWNYCADLAEISCESSLGNIIQLILARFGKTFKRPNYLGNWADATDEYGKPFYYLFYKSDIWFNISDILYNI